mgnify:FL=1
MVDLGTLSSNYYGTGSRATDVNNEGDVVGFSGSFTGAVHGFIYRNGVMTDLNDFLSSEQRNLFSIVEANGINDSGQIIATAIGSFGSYHAVLLTPTIPEPSTTALLAIGFGAIAWARRRKLSRPPSPRA